MQGLFSTAVNPFVPKVTADTVVRHNSSDGLSKQVAVGPASDLAVGVIGVTSIIAIGTFVLMPLYEAFQRLFTAPKKLELLAELGCKTVTAKFLPAQEVNERRRITVQLGDEVDTEKQMHFIERNTEDGSGRTEIYVKDGYGHERLDPRFNKLENVTDFYKNDIKENREGIYDSYAPHKPYLNTTLGVALSHLGSGEFDGDDLHYFAKFFNLDPNKLDVEAFKKLTPLTSDERQFLLNVRVHYGHLNNWNPNNTVYLKNMVQQGFSDGLMGVYKFIFTDKALQEKISLGAALTHLGSDNFNENDLQCFAKLFNLDVSQLTVDTFKDLAPLSKHEKEFLFYMGTDPAHSAGWDRNNTDHLLGMAKAGLSDGLLGVYQLIFTDDTLKKSVSLANEIQALIQSTTLIYPPRSSEATANITIHGGIKVELKTSGYFQEPGSYMVIVINGKSEKLNGIEFGELKEKISEYKDEHGSNYEKIIPISTAEWNSRLLNSANKMLSGLVNTKPTTSSKTCQQQIDVDKSESRSKLVSVRIGSKGNAQKISTFLTENGELRSDLPYDAITCNTVYLLVSQQLYGNFGMAINHAFKQARSVTQGTPTKRMEEQEYVLTIPDDYLTSRKIILKSSVAVGTDRADVEGEFVFNANFHKELANRDFLKGTDTGIESSQFTKVEIRVEDENSF